jgi:carbon-monoxide dehydrogenase large subunit
VTAAASKAELDATALKPSVGEPLPSLDAHRFAHGLGRYLSDVELPGCRHVGILRSAMPHARIKRLDLQRALSIPGVRAAFTGTDLAPFSRPIEHLLPTKIAQPLSWGVLAMDVVRYVGEPLAVVIADTASLAEDALAAIEVEYEPLPVVIHCEQALAPDSPLLYPEWGTNQFVAIDFSTGDIDQAFKAADGVLTKRLTHHRICGSPLEGHGAAASYDPNTGKLLIYASSQQPHNLRTLLSDVTMLNEAAIRVIVPDMGGGFGNKQHFMREEALIAVLAMRLSYPIRWIQDRTESLTASVHSREQIHDLEVAYRRDGRILGIRANVLSDLGNPVLYFTGAAPAMKTAGVLTGAYDIQNYEYHLKAVATNKCPIGAYRGFGQPQAAFSIERIMDLVAEAVGIDPASIRRLNLIPDDQRPYVTATGSRLDVGPLREQLNAALALSRYDEFPSRKKVERERGRYVGIGLATIVLSTAPSLYRSAGRYGGFEMVAMTVHPDGFVTLVAGTQASGQGHRTMLAQVAADALRIPFHRIDVRDGDTDAVPYGMGSWGSRSAVMGGGAVIKAAGLIEKKMSAIAAHLLGGPDTDRVTRSADGSFMCNEGTISFKEIASTAYLHTGRLPLDIDMGLSVVVSYDPRRAQHAADQFGKANGSNTYASVTAVATVEVIVGTGVVRIEDMVIVYDCGHVINPMLVESQIQGGFAQGLGAVLSEEFIYGADGRPLTDTFSRYKLPQFGSVTRARLLSQPHPSDLLGGFRGAGEIGTVCAPPAIANAVHDALSFLGIQITQTNLDPRRLRELLRRAESAGNPSLNASQLTLLNARTGLRARPSG